MLPVLICTVIGATGLVAAVFSVIVGQYVEGLVCAVVGVLFARIPLIYFKERAEGIATASSSGLGTYTSPAPSEQTSVASSALYSSDTDQ